MSEQFCPLELCKRLADKIGGWIGDPEPTNFCYYDHLFGEPIEPELWGTYDDGINPLCPAYTLGELVEYMSKQGWAFDFGNGSDGEFFCHVAVPGEGNPFPFGGHGANSCEAVAEAILAITESEGKNG